MFCLALNERENDFINAMLAAAGLTALGSFRPLPPEHKWSEASLARLRPHRLSLLRFVQAPELPEVADLGPVPNSFYGWRARCAMLMTMSPPLVYLVSEAALQSLDVTAHLVLARQIEVPTVGIVPADLRAAVDATQLTFTDLTISGTVVPSLMAAVLTNLTEDQE